MSYLTSGQRGLLESGVKKARKVAEAGARNALQTLAVNSPEPFEHMSSEQRSLRNRLRSKGRLLGDELSTGGPQEIKHLSTELAYDYWHKMLFARFLEANGLLIHSSGVAVSLEECEELAKEEGYADKWNAASHFASAMLPAIFRPQDPLMQVEFAAEDRIKLETLLDDIESSIFVADDSLGWVYQFWQSEIKDAINKSGDKINGEKLPAVTQLFTEPYMVHFLIDNTIGAWWISRHMGEKTPVNFEYLRLLEDGKPAAGRFEGWPERAAQITMLDPCMGSGHFVVSVFKVLTQLRMYEENMTEAQATDKVIIENLHGLEIDPRCTQIAAFNLALAAWKFCGKYRELPEMNLACCGIAPLGKKEDWVKLVGKIERVDDKARMENGMKVLYDHFQLAPELGSLLDPSSIKADAFTASFEELQPILLKALAEEKDKDLLERGVIAAGIAKAGEILSRKYVLQITNVPYLARGKQDALLLNYCSENFPESKGDLATIFLEKMLKYSTIWGTTCSVIPQNWLFLTTYKKFRENLLQNRIWQFVIRLGSGAFSQISGEVVKAILIAISNKKPQIDQIFSGIDVSDESNATEKNEELKKADIKRIKQFDQLKNPDARVVIEVINHTHELLQKYAYSVQGTMPADRNRLVQCFWEFKKISQDFVFMHGSSSSKDSYNGMSQIFKLKLFEEIYKDIGGRFQGQKAWNKVGIVVSIMSDLPISLYTGEIFDGNVHAISPIRKEHLPAIYSYALTEEFRKEIRKIDQKVSVTCATICKIPFDLNYWQNIAFEKYPLGIPKPYSEDPTQWLFHGHPVKALNPLQVATSRLLGYNWPSEGDNKMELADEAKVLINSIKPFDYLADDDGIICLSSVNNETSASERLREYLQVVLGDLYNINTIAQFLEKEGSNKNRLEDWLRDEFFDQHCKLFNNHPFIWHIWDGRKDGFGALVNYHKLTKENLRKLIYTYLGDWIRQCEFKNKKGESGSEGLLSAALKLKEKLERILEGESPYDIFVRWKQIEKQPVGWDPDLNDGVRLNIRPFITADVLRKKPNIKWGIDRGKNPKGSPWGEIRDNDKHLTLEEKRNAKEE